MNGYEVVVARCAVKTLASLPRSEQQRVRAAIDLLAAEPRPPGCIALEGEPGVYRVRVGDHRIVYEVHDQQLVIQVIRVGHRRDVYR
ncbi:MAG: type II toxin-antitoxin system RelE family toxin [Acidimicrobiia bacterium]